MFVNCGGNHSSQIAGVQVLSRAFIVSLITVMGFAHIALSQTQPVVAETQPSLGHYSFYLGNLHAHSVYSGDHAKVVAEKENHGAPTYDKHTPAQVLERAKASGYDFFAITDHSSPEQNPFYAGGFTEQHWRDTIAQTKKHTTKAFLALYGFEFSRNVNKDKGGLGHMNVINTDTWKSGYAPGNTFLAMYDWLALQKKALVVGQFNHPALGPPPAKSFNDYVGRTRERNEVVSLAEIWNSTEKMSHVKAVKKIWALGWKVAPSAGTDTHGIFGNKKTLRTGVLARSLTKEEILGAIRARRVYATVEPKLHLEYQLNGHEMGTALSTRPSGDLSVDVLVEDPGTVIERVEVFGGNYDTHGGATSLLATMKVGAGSRVVKNKVPNGHDLYYVVVYKEGKKDPVAFSAPVWMDNL